MLKKLFMAASVSFADLATGNLSYKMTDSLSLDFSPSYISFDAYSLYLYNYSDGSDTSVKALVGIPLVSPSISVPFSIVYNHCPSLSFGYDVSMLIRYSALKWTNGDDKNNSYIKDDKVNNIYGGSTKFSYWPMASLFVEYNFAIWSVKYHLGQALYAYNMYSLTADKTRIFTHAESVLSVLHGFEFKLNICRGWIASILLNSIFRSGLTWVAFRKFTT